MQKSNMSTKTPESTACHTQITLTLVNGLTKENVDRAIAFMQEFGVHVTEEERQEHESRIVFRIKDRDIKYYPDDGEPLSLALNRDIRDTEPLISGYKILNGGPLLRG